MTPISSAINTGEEIMCQKNGRNQSHEPVKNIYLVNLFDRWLLSRGVFSAKICLVIIH